MCLCARVVVRCGNLKINFIKYCIELDGESERREGFALILSFAALSRIYRVS